jgi:hypothetical protein
MFDQTSITINIKLPIEEDELESLKFVSAFLQSIINKKILEINKEIENRNNKSKASISRRGAKEPFELLELQTITEDQEEDS